MPISQLQLPGNQINSTVDPSAWATLGNLGNVYQKAQEDAKTRSVLASLGQSPEADAASLLHSGIPSLAQMGINLRQQANVDRRADAELLIRQADEARRAGDHADADKKEAAAYAALKSLGQPTAPAPAAAPSFPAPLPGAAPQAAIPPGAVPPAAPPAGPQPPLNPAEQQMMAMVRPPAPAPQAPEVPGVLPAPPAAGVAPSPIAPSELAATTSAAPPSIVDRATQVLTSGKPPAAAGITREHIADLIMNPATKELGVALAQAQYGENKPIVVNEGQRLVVKRPDGSFQDITPGGSQSKEERETSGYYKAAIAQGATPEQARAFALNKGKMPSENLSVHAQKAIDDNDNIYMSANTAVDNIKRLQELSPKAFQGWGASALGAVTGQTGEGAGTATTEYNNIALRNVIAMVKSAFPRPTEYETKLMQRIETGADMPRNVRDDLLVDLKKQLQLRASQAQAKSNAIRAGTYYKPGGDTLPADDTPAAPSAPPAASAAAKPSLGDFMKAARAANPGTPDSELARYWKKEYGG